MNDTLYQCVRAVAASLHIINESLRGRGGKDGHI
jgi:hypothetical protein